SCAFAHRKIYRSMRVLEDYVGMVGSVQEGSGVIYRAFEGNQENFLWNPKYKSENSDLTKYEPRSGDVLLSRGSANTSAAIARITNEDSNFSHMGIVYIDPKTKKIETIEAHIEKGSLVTDISAYKDMKSRALVFRFHDPSLTDQQNAQIAHEAATQIRKVVLKYHNSYKLSIYPPNICYDFSMTVDNPKEFDFSQKNCLFCSEVVSLGFSLVGDGKYKIPTFLSDINPKNRSFIESLGVKAKKTFAPADIEIDPYFDLVLEWRDYNRVHASHRLDSILTVIYSWMDDYDYQFYKTDSVSLKSKFGYIVRRIPILNSLLGVKDKFPLNMSKNAIETIQMLDIVSNILNNYLIDQENQAGNYLTPKQMITLLNHWREQDLAEYSTSEPDKVYGKEEDTFRAYRFHQFFRAKEETH
ncbi:MAG: hypothetical protein KDD45_15560, partial [Bdellovibrionales bacterium]|nr:hypothetical protein [Bdellovibrionales bacterium]